jgi:hypothetical protein
VYPKNILNKHVKEIPGKYFTSIQAVSARGITDVSTMFLSDPFWKHFSGSLCVSQRNSFHIIVAVSTENI